MRLSKICILCIKSFQMHSVLSSWLNSFRKNYSYMGPFHGKSGQKLLPPAKINFSQNTSGNISFRVSLLSHTCLLRRTEEKNSVQDQITWRFCGWHMHGFSGIYPVGHILNLKIGYVQAQVKLLQSS